MKISNFIFFLDGKIKKYNLISNFLAFMGLIFLMSCGSIRKSDVDYQVSIPTSIVGVQHLGSGFSIPRFYVNKYSGGAMGRNEGGAGYTCCVSLPKKWRPGLIAEVRWEVVDWTHEIRSEILEKNYRSIRSEGMYIAQVPVEKYDEIGNLYVHFFPGGKVRVVTSIFSISNSEHPVRLDSDDSKDIATIGRRVTEIFTADELGTIN